MNKKTLFSFLTLVFVISGYSQNQLWNRIESASIEGQEKLDRASQPAAFLLYNLNLENLKAQLQQAPQRFAEQTSSIVLPFPDGDGNMIYYTIYEAPVMDTELSEKHQNIKSYVGEGVEDASSTIRFSITPFGFHNMLHSTKGTSYIDPYTKNLQNYIVYNRKGLARESSFYCGVVDEANNHANQRSAEEPFGVTASDGVLRTYRLAMACTIEYAAFHVDAAGLNDGTLAEKKEAVLAAMVITVARVNSVYERDLSITLVLIPDNEDVIFIDSDDFTNNDAGTLIDESQTVIDDIIGFDNYDIGHTVSTGGGGLAQLWAPCSNSKARGITGLAAPVGDPYDIDYVAHEIGHQFGGQHSYNNACSGNRSNANAYEPGSGSTIMAYAGICPPNVQSNSDAHFHANSIAQMTEFMTTDGNCSENTVTGNTAPVADAGDDYVIPYGTAFILSGTGTDADNDEMTYNWEQMDREISEQPPVATSNEGPNFRSFPSKDVPERYMPDIEAVLDNNLTPTWEVIANVAREYNFAFTVRDNNVAGGQTVIDYMKIDVSGTAGPFLVSIPNTNVSWQAGTNQDVEWDVAGTTANGVNAPYVDIFLSTDGGYTYPIVLAAKVPNDGSEVIAVPNVVGNNNRIMVRGYRNIFYDISNTNFTITAPESTMAFAVTGLQNIADCVGGDVSYNLNYEAYEGFSADAAFTVTGTPEGATVAFDPETISADGVVTLTVSTDGDTVPGFYTMPVVATSGGVTKTINVYLDLIDPNFGNLDLIEPADGSEAVFTGTSFDWTNIASAVGYEIEISEDEDFADLVVATTVTENSYTGDLEEGVRYYWRIRPINEACAGNFGEASSFVTGVTACNDYEAEDLPITISNSESGDYETSISIAEGATVQSLTVSLDITHSWVSDLTVTLVSPDNTEVELFSDVCFDRNDVLVTFDDNAEQGECGNNPAIGGTIQAQNSLSAFIGGAIEGDWTLRVEDGFNADGGSINAWSLNICTTEAVDLASVEAATFNDFALYPNPNNGNFTVRYNTASSSDVSVMVYDIRGRQLLNKTYENTGLFEQSIDLGATEAGIYLVTVQEGGDKITKKIVVQ
ncbi:MAG: hypothetical protein BM557_10545 [Flavobacterium sp. MedPE-SWcel]|uniref:zinc-dependent metalloprotease n=1 Tax=uncultured Flavobacterium sp. TaxID=165435 RepID=UPI00091D4B31|nr:zinc-dependent metalloprotease family protein [uncultured Flavobacterium sp.]OIQ15987.1 MAG: hypothetical protein BM557_10545 [Flavobacterium sp. MedPE-SWcel]